MPCWGSRHSKNSHWLYKQPSFIALSKHTNYPSKYCSNPSKYSLDPNTVTLLLNNTSYNIFHSFFMLVVTMSEASNSAAWGGINIYMQLILPRFWRDSASIWAMGVQICKHRACLCHSVSLGLCSPCPACGQQGCRSPWKSGQWQTALHPRYQRCGHRIWNVGSSVCWSRTWGGGCRERKAHNTDRLHRRNRWHLKC